MKQVITHESTPPNEFQAELGFKGILLSQSAIAAWLVAAELTDVEALAIMAGSTDVFSGLEAIGFPVVDDSLPIPPAWTTIPSITGTTMQGSTLTGVSGVVSGGDITASQWQRNGNNISGATTNTYVLGIPDVGTQITYRQTATNEAGSVSSVSNPTETIIESPVYGEADFIVSNDSEYSAAHTAATAGQIIELANGGSFGTLTLTKQNITVRGASIGGHVVRNVIMNGCAGSALLGVHIQPNIVPAGKPKLLAITGNMDGCLISGNTIRGGNPWNGFADFDPTYHDEARMGSNALGWGTVNPYAQDLWTGIGQGASGSPSGSITFTGNIVSDCGDLVKFVWGGGGRIIIAGNQFHRAYQDSCAIGLDGVASVDQIGFWYLGNLATDSFAQPQDNGNPHGDVLQYFGDDFATGGFYDYPLRDVRIVGNVYYQRPGCRGEPQQLFISDYHTGSPLEHPLIYGNVMMSRVSNIYAVLSAPDTGSGAVWGLLDRNIFLPNPLHNAAIQNELFTNTTSGILAANPTTSRVAVTSDANYTPAPNAPSMVRRTIAEKIQQSTNLVIDESVSIGSRGSTADAFSAYFDLPAGYADWTAFWNDWNSEEDVFKLVNSFKTAYAPMSPLGSATSMFEYRAKWANWLTAPWNEIPPAVIVLNQTGVAKSSTIMSQGSYVHAGGQTVTISVTGGEYRVADNPQMTTNVSSWGTSGTVAHGKYLQFRQTSGSADLQLTTMTITLGSETFDWSVQTLDMAVFSRVLFTATEPDIIRAAAAGLGADGTVGTLALLGFKMTAPAATRTIFGSNSGTPRVQVQILATGHIRVSVFNSSAVAVARFETTGAVAPANGTIHDLLISWDVSQANQTVGASVYLDGANVQYMSAEWSGPGTINYGYTPGTYQLNATSSDFELGAFYLNTAARINPTNPTNRALFSPSSIGASGQGPTGSSPVIYITGVAAAYNDAGGINLGTGAKFVKVGTTAITDV